MSLSARLRSGSENWGLPAETALGQTWNASLQGRSEELSIGLELGFDDSRRSEICVILKHLKRYVFLMILID